MSIIYISVILMLSVGIIAAVLLYVAAKKFHVEEDPRIEEIENLLPGANCGGCGRSGCHDFACAVASATSMDGLFCPSTTEENLREIVRIAGLEAVHAEPKAAVVKCFGTCSNRKITSNYEGPRTCAIESLTYSGDTDCAYGCLGFGDCAAVCPYDALHIDESLHIPVTDYSKCVGCGKCVSACPHGIIELAVKKKESPLYWVACMNHDKGAVAMKECDAACIGCGKCVRACESQAITINRFLASIDSSKCTACGKCIEECPRDSIHSVN